MSLLDLFHKEPLNFSTENFVNGTWDDGKIKKNEFIIVEIIVAFLAVAGNSIVITVFCRNRKLRKKANFYIISLACADFCVGICGIPLAISLVNFLNHFPVK